MAENTLQIPIQGMTRERQIEAVRSAVEAVEGVISVEADAEQKQIIVRYDDARAKSEDLQALIEGRGYAENMYGVDSPDIK